MIARGWRKENGGSLCLEDPSSPSFSAERDVKGILWERVTADQQAAEIRQTRPSTSYRPK